MERVLGTGVVKIQKDGFVSVDGEGQLVILMVLEEGMDRHRSQPRMVRHFNLLRDVKQQLL